MCPTHDDDSPAHQHEGKQRAYAGHVSDKSNRRECREQADKEHEQQVTAPGGPKPWVHIGKRLGQQTVTRHRKEHARLPHQHDQNDRG
jgi:hypothetical protein